MVFDGDEAMPSSPNLDNYIKPGFHVIKPISINFTTIVITVMTTVWS